MFVKVSSWHDSRKLGGGFGGRVVAASERGPQREVLVVHPQGDPAGLKHQLNHSPLVQERVDSSALAHVHRLADRHAGKEARKSQELTRLFVYHGFGHTECSFPEDAVRCRQRRVA
jgi:hypothetical protein